MNAVIISSPKGGSAVVGHRKQILSYKPSKLYELMRRKLRLKPKPPKGRLVERYELQVIQSGELLPVHRQSAYEIYDHRA